MSDEPDAGRQFAFTVESARALAEKAKIRDRPPTFIPSRYPYTYAYDFYRSHSPLLLSRGEVAGGLRDNPDREEIVRILADAYLAEHGIVRPSKEIS